MEGAKYNCMEFISFIANVENIFNLIGREEYSIDSIVLLLSKLYYLTKKETFDFRGAENKIY